MNTFYPKNPKNPKEPKELEELEELEDLSIFLNQKDDPYKKALINTVKTTGILLIEEYF